MTHQNVVEYVEQALRSEPWCAACGSPMTVVDESSGLWLECTTIGRQRSRRSWLGRLVPHTRRLLLDAEAIEPAA
jgi:hypothetical protein